MLKMWFLNFFTSKIKAQPKKIQKAVEVYENICQMTPIFFIAACLQLQAPVEGGQVSHFFTSKTGYRPKSTSKWSQIGKSL